MMSTQKLPRGLTHAKIRRIIEHYENQTGEEAVAEEEAAFAEGRGYRTMHVPIEVEGQVLKLIARAEEAKRARQQETANQVAETRKGYGKA